MQTAQMEPCKKAEQVEGSGRTHTHTQKHSDLKKGVACASCMTRLVITKEMCGVSTLFQQVNVK